MVVALAEALSEETFGGKASSLARAIGAGLPVPEGFALSWECVDRVARGDEQAIELLRAKYGGDRVAARSSAVGEDSVDASFAGQHLTLLNIVSADSLVDAVRTIHASAHDPAAVEYRKKMGVAGDPRMAVVVMRMIDCSTAGVLFTRNPMTGENERVIESSWGLGEAVVSGLVTPDAFRISPGGEIVERRAGRKDFVIRFAPGGGVIERPVAPADISRLSLQDGHLTELHLLAQRCEAFFQRPQDIEWAFEGETLYLLQSRPITTGSPAVSVSDDRSGAGSASLTVSQPHSLIEAGNGGVDPTGRGSEPSPSRTAEGDDPGEQELSARVFAGLALAALLAPLNSTIIAVALPTIATSLDASAPLVTRWMVTAYLVVSIIAQSPAGKLADRWGTSRVLTLGRASFGLGALLAAFAPTLTVLGTGRVLMAVGGALTIPTVFAQLRNSVPADRRGRVFGLFGAILGGAAAVGPLIGGFLTARFGWHSVFLVNVPVVLLSFALVPPHRSRSARGALERFDFLGSAILGGAVLLLVGAVERTSLGLLAVTLVLVAAFIARELRAPDPVLDVRLFRRRAFAAGSAIVALQNLAMYSMIFLLPFVLAQGGTEPAATGRMLLFFTLAMVLASPLGGRLSDAAGSRLIALSGAILATAGAALFVTGDYLLASLVLMGGGIGIATSPSQAAAISAVGPAEAGVASGALSTMRYVGGVIGSGLVALLVAGGIARDSRLLVFPAVLLASAFAALLLPGKIGRASKSMTPREHSPEARASRVRPAP
jgi:EmrB/QacA subfamily drug resistance transporter